MGRKREKGGDAASVGCETCIYRDTCEQAEEGTWCTRWRDREPEDRGPDPNQAWIRGEDAVF